MKKEIDLLKNYPKSKRDIKKRSTSKSDEVRSVARKFGKEFFDGDRKYGYGGFSYASRFWEPVIPTFKQHFNLNEKSSLLDVGCAKGFMLYDLIRLIPGISVKGIDISEYAIQNAKKEVRTFVEVGNAVALPYESNSFDIVISINTIHNLDKNDCFKSIKEIERVSKKGSFITVDAYRNEDEKERMDDWNLTAKTIMSVKDWNIFFDEAGYTGDRYWFLP